MQSHRKGEATEATVIAELKQRGISVSLPFGDNERYDAIVETPDGRPLRVQIKTANYRNGVLEVSGESQHTNAQGHQYKQYAGDIDYFLAYSDVLETMYWIPEERVETRISLRVDQPEQVDGSINWAEEYEFDEQWPPDPTADKRLGHGSTAKKILSSLDELGITAWYSTQDVPYHIIVERENGELLRLRVRSVSLNDGVHTLVATDTLDREHVDYILAHSHELDQTYLVGTDEFDASIALRVADTVQHRSTVNWADEYELAARQDRLA
jgi:Uri superfamily endonuclease